MRRRLLIGVAVALIGGLAQAQVAPAPGPGDPRLQVVAYDPYQVVELNASLGFQTMIEFGPDERIETISIGDAAGWQVTPNRKADLLFVKPLDKSTPTNMAVVTSKRRYSFQLAARTASGPRDPRLVYGLRFSYPPEPEPAPPPPPTPPGPVNSAYSIAGAERLTATKVFDDGRSTWFQFPAEGETPAVFALDSAGQESIVNFTVRGDYVVVDQIGPAFVLRRGKEVATARNDAYRGAPLDPKAAPKPPSRWRLFKRSDR